MTDRNANLDILKSGRTFDMLVIGGGATGCGIAVDAASRGLSVALVERGDFGCGTSSKSTKLLHGGVRYLESAVLHRDRVQFNLVRDGLHERNILLKIAPHLSHRLTLVTPLYGLLQVPYVWAGLKLYDLLAGEAGLGHSRFVGRGEMLRRFPMIRGEGLKGGVQYYDGQFNDVRMNVALAQTATGEGAVIANYVEVVALMREKGRVAGAVVRDPLVGASWQIRARCVVNACGSSADIVRRLDDPTAASLLRVSRGIHIILPGRFAPVGAGVMIPKTDDGRVLFVLPWEGNCLVGTTEEPAEAGEVPMAREKDVDYLLRHLRRYFKLGAKPGDITASWAGLRPLVHDPFTADTAELARDHVVSCSPTGLITIVGGKWTSYRKMALDAVNFAVNKAGLTPQHPCHTDRIMLAGGEHFGEALLQELERKHGFPPDVTQHLYHSYGDRSLDVALYCQGAFGGRLLQGHPYLKGEVLYAAHHEMALRALDFLERRVPLALLDRRGARAAAPEVVALMAAELGWNTERQKRELEEVADALREA
ncbi:FAD-dependent oxidoreductase [Geomonas oryzisoli]|uniref:FAD-dependent oxidoreductase n=1 Tax=Geomonas oryzisoli TaxID=2847992 RepID=A0ABX8J758_9BACT|nr:FAD-dependent oxidoreductase [Geomonas oryzisoli]QWV94270.1 FAD-dependent oxidoreductase [Geomonas oryzisoli]